MASEQPTKTQKAVKAVKEKAVKEKKEEKEVCPICADVYTAVVRRKMVCKFCHKDACTKCIEHYLLSRPEDAHCIHCRVNYSDTVLKDICTKTYLQQTYFRHRQEVLVNRERAHLPELQDEAQRLRRIRAKMAEERALQVELDTLKEAHRKLLVRYSVTYTKRLEHLKGGHSTKEDDELLQQFGTEEKEVLVQIAAQKERIRNASRQRRWGDEDGDGKEAKAETEEKEKAEEEEAKKKKFIRRCMKAGCQGFLSTAWKCGICDHYSCSKCFTVRGPAHDTPHTCAKEDLETAELIRSDSKPCPKCGEFINRSSGCSQMFCVTCRTPWDWNTGKIVTKGVIHNPHYYEWLRRNGGEMPRNPADIPCGGYPQGYELRPIHQCASKRCAKYFFEFHRVCMEIQEDTERNYRSHLDEGGLRDTHVRFLLGDFDERVWGQRLAQAEKRRKRDAEIQEVFTAFRMVAVELLNRIQHYRDETVDVFTLLPSGKANAYLEEWHKEVVALIQMVNEGLKVISLSHHCSVPHIDIVEMTRGVFYRYDTRLWKEESARRMKRNQPRNGNQVAEEEEEKKQEEIESVPFSDTEDEDEEDEEVQLALAIERSLVRHE